MLTREQALDKAIRRFPLVLGTARFLLGEMKLSDGPSGLFVDWLKKTGRDRAICLEFQIIMEKEIG